MKSSLLKLCLFACVSLFSVACSHPISAYLIASVFPPSVVEVGDDMVDAKLLDINGKKKRISDYMSKKYLLLNFGGGCGNFIASLPEVEEVSETFKENLTFIIINVDTKTQWKELMDKYDIAGINLRDPKTVRGLAYKYGANFSTPHYVIISHEGKVVDRWTGFSDGRIKEKVSKKVLDFGSTE